MRVQMTEKQRKKIKKIASKFDVLFQNFFEVASTSYSKKEFCCDSNGLIDYISRNFFVLLKFYYPLSFENCNLIDLTDFSDFFLSIAKTHKEYADSFFALFLESNIKKLTLTKIADTLPEHYICNQIKISDHINYRPIDGFEMLDLVGFDTVPLSYSDYFLMAGNAYTYEHFAHSYVIDNNKTANIDQFNTYQAFRLEYPNPQNISFEKEMFSNFSFDDYMYLFWWTYNTLVFDNGIVKSNNTVGFKSKIVTKAEKEALISRYVERLFDKIEHNSQDIQAEAYFETCYILLNNVFISKSDESLSAFMSFAIAVAFILTTKKRNDKFYYSLTDLPDEIETFIINRKNMNADDLLNYFCEMVKGFFDDLKVRNSKYNYESSFKSDPFRQAEFVYPFELEMNEWFASNGFPLPKDSLELERIAHTAYELKSCGLHREKEENFIKEFERALENYKTKRILVADLDILFVILKMLTMICEAFSVAQNIKSWRIAQRLCCELSNYLIKDSFDSFLYESDKLAVDVEKKNYKDIQAETEYTIKMNATLENGYFEFLKSVSDLSADEVPLNHLINLKILWTTRFKMLGADEKVIEIINIFLEKLRFFIEEKSSRTNAFNNIFNKIKTEFSVSQSKILTAIKKYGLSIEDLDVRFTDMIKTLSTGEFLYQKYITDACDDLEDFDYSCIALQYYTALESLLNIVFYLPYKTITLEPLGKRLKQLEGYLGEAEFSKLESRSKLKDSVLKDSLELGPIAYLYKGIFDSNGAINATHIHLSEYLTKLGLNNKAQKAVAKIAKDVGDITTSRNKVAHASVPVSSSQVSRAKKSVFANYIMNKNSAKRVADNCRNLIPQILALFE